MSVVSKFTDASSKTTQEFKDCWGCRQVSGAGMFLSAAYVFNAARRMTRQGAPASMGTVAQITFAAGLAVWGFIVLSDPDGNRRGRPHE